MSANFSGIFTDIGTHQIRGWIKMANTFTYSLSSQFGRQTQKILIHIPPVYPDLMHDELHFTLKGRVRQPYPVFT